MNFFGDGAKVFAAMPGTACNVRWRCSARHAGSGGLARAGARVVITSRKADACAAVVEQIRSEGLEATAIACNISRKDEVLGLVEQTEKVYGTVDVLVCNAAVNPYYGPMSGITDEAFSKVMDVNIRSNLWLVNRTAPGMAAKGGGSVVIISSIAGLTGSRVLGAYGTSKAADMSLARSLALEWGKQGIRTNCIAPGLIKTDFAKALWDNPEYLDKRLQSAPLRRIGEPDDIGGIAVMLAGKAGAFITGQTIIADAGVTIGS